MFPAIFYSIRNSFKNIIFSHHIKYKKPCNYVKILLYPIILLLFCLHIYYWSNKIDLLFPVDYMCLVSMFLAFVFFIFLLNIKTRLNRYSFTPVMLLLFFLVLHVAVIYYHAVNKNISVIFMFIAIVLPVVLLYYLSILKPVWISTKFFYQGLVIKDPFGSLVQFTFIAAYTTSVFAVNVYNYIKFNIIVVPDYTVQADIGKLPELVESSLQPVHINTRPNINTFVTNLLINRERVGENALFIRDVKHLKTTPQIGTIRVFYMQTCNTVLVPGIGWLKIEPYLKDTNIIWNNWDTAKTHDNTPVDPGKNFYWWRFCTLTQIQNEVNYLLDQQKSKDMTTYQDCLAINAFASTNIEQLMEVSEVFNQDDVCYHYPVVKKDVLDIINTMPNNTKEYFLCNKPLLKKRLGELIVERHLGECGINTNTNDHLIERHLWLEHNLTSPFSQYLSERYPNKK